MESKNPKIFLISGKARNGKDTVADLIIKNYQNSGLKILKLAYGSYIKMYAKNISNWDGNEETKPRELLQQLGTDLIRNKIDELLFVNRICEDIKVYSYFFDALIISDVRMKNEMEIPEALFDNVVKIKVVRPNFETPLTETEQNHKTECDLDNYNDYDYIINNDSDLNELEKKVNDILKEVKNEH